MAPAKAIDEAHRDARLDCKVNSKLRKRKTAMDACFDRRYVARLFGDSSACAATNGIRRPVNSRVGDECFSGDMFVYGIAAPPCAGAAGVWRNSRPISCRQPDRACQLRPVLRL